ncbi:MAG: hypothetical protein MUC96_21430 [Myxococcaceae bacterium]|nr:hypothetical protein [Myxococcaceae bacterium]
MPAGPLVVAFTLERPQGHARASFCATVVERDVPGVGPGRIITVQYLVDVRVEAGEQRYLVSDEALVVLLGLKGVQPDVAHSSPLEPLRRWFGLRTPPAVVFDGRFRLLERGESKLHHAGIIALEHPERA